MFYILLLSLSLSVDALGIGLSLGARGIKISFGARLVIALLCFFITFFSIALGKVFSEIISPITAALLSAFMLVFLGIWIIFEAVKKEPLKKEAPEKIHTLIFKSIRITVQIIRTPPECDLDKSKNIDFKEALYLGLALSLDSFGVGFGSGIGSLSSPLIPLFAAVSQSIFISLGSFLAGRIKPKNENLFTIISGIIIIIIGCSKLI